MSLVYLDSSAIVKLVVAEEETDALRHYLRQAPRQSIAAVVSSRIAQAEVSLAVRRRFPDLLALAQEVFRGIYWIGASDGLISRAGLSVPERLRTLDALHLTTALGEVDHLREVVTYDHRMAEACQRAGLSVCSPGQGES